MCIKTTLFDIYDYTHIIHIHVDIYHYDLGSTSLYMGMMTMVKSWLNIQYV